MGETICANGDGPRERWKPRGLVCGDAIDETAPCPGKAADMECHAKRVCKYMCMLTADGNAVVGSGDLVPTVLAND